MDNTGDDNINVLVDLISDADQSEDEHNINITLDQKETDAFEIISNADREDDVSDESLSCIDQSDDPLECNRQLLNFWLQLKEHTTALLQKVEHKLTAVEIRMKNRYLSNKQILFYTPGIPYFKDRHHFSARPNEDEQIKKLRNEIHVDALPKVCPWTPNDRSTLLKLIKEEAITSVLQSQENVNTDNKTSKSKLKRNSNTEKKNDNTILPSDFKGMVGPLGTREFDWAYIANTCFYNKHSALDCRVMWNVFLHPDINKSGWKKSEDIKLIEIARAYRYQNWDEVSKELDTNRTAYQCFIRYHSTCKLPEIKNCFWPTEQDNKLCKLVEAFRMGDFIQWREVASFIDNRTKQQAYFRWTYSLSQGLIKGRFTKEENDILLEAVKKYGPNFRKISADLMPHRSPVQLSDHYQRLQPDGVKQENTWTEEQDNKLLMLYTQFGPKWTQIAPHFEGKTRTQVRHRHTAVRKLIKKGVRVFRTGLEREDNEGERNTEQLKKENLGRANKKIDTDDVDIKLIEYFRTRIASKKSKPLDEHDDVEELENYTKSLYSVLKILDAQLDIPEYLDDLPLNNRQKELLSSLKVYSQLRNSKEYQKEMVERCASQMFPSLSKQESLSLASQNVRKRKKNSKESPVIDYNLHQNDAFKVDITNEIETPDCVKNVITKEDDIIFAKLCRLLQSTYYSNSQQPFHKKRRLLSSNIHADNSASTAIPNRTSLYYASNKCLDITPHTNPEVQGNFVPNLFTVSSIYKEQPNTASPHRGKLPESTNETVAIEPTLESLLGLKNLLYVRNLSKWVTENSEAIHLKNETNKDQIDDNTNRSTSTRSSHEYDEAYSLLERRMLQLLKYPLGLSKTELPNVQSTNM